MVGAAGKNATPSIATKEKKVALPGNRLAVKWLRCHRPIPEINLLLVRAPFVEEAEPGRGTTDKAASLLIFCSVLFIGVEVQ
jgi:hypothetical protein